MKNKKPLADEDADPPPPMTDPEQKDHQHKSSPLRVIGGAAVGALVLFGVWGSFVIGQENIAWWGPFGDSFAPVVGFFSTMTLAAAVTSLWYQRAELKAALDHLEATTKVLTRQSNLQNEANDLQRSANVLAEQGIKEARAERKKSEMAAEFTNDTVDRNDRHLERANVLAVAAANVEIMKIEAELVAMAPGDKSDFFAKYVMVKNHIEDRALEGLSHDPKEVTKIMLKADIAEYAMRFYSIEKELDRIRQVLQKRSS